MKYASRLKLAALCAVQLTISGCAGGAGSLSELIQQFFGGSDPTDVLANLTSSGIDAFGAFGGLGDGGPGGGGGGGANGDGGGISDLGGGSDGEGLGGTIGEIASIGNIATVHHPEPGSMALFGGGLAGTALVARRRRKNSKRSKS